MITLTLIFGVSFLVSVLHAGGMRIRPLAWLIWLAMLPAFIVVVLSRYPLARAAVRAAGDADHLTGFYRYLDTIDNTLDGDGGHRERCRAAGLDKFASRVAWIKRNGGNCAAYHWFGVAEGEDYPLLRKTFANGVEPFFGWNTPGPQLGRVKYNFGLRIH